MIQNGTALYRSDEIRKIEALLGTTGLMEKAGLAIATLARTLIADATRPILVIVGPGNNGGDALVAARFLQQWQFHVIVVMFADPQKLPPDAYQAYEQWVALNAGTAKTIPEANFALLLDGLFGIGLQRTISGDYLALIAQINALPCPKLAIDIPSGLMCDSGRVLGMAVKATHTLTFIARKPGLYTLDGPDYAGSIHLADLGIQATEHLSAPGHLLEQALFQPALPPRKANSHKGKFGSVAIIGGAEGTVGAVLLAARAALLCGAGRVYACLLAENSPAVDWQQPEIMLCGAETLTKLAQLDCVVIGPGLGQSTQAIGLLEYWIAQDVPLLLDADALNLLATHAHLKAALQSRKATSIITPHPGEAAKLLNTANTEVQKNRIQNAQHLAQTLNAICVLKGAGSVCAEPGGLWHINTSGNPALASAGSGDVLSGIIGSFVAQGLGALDATKLGVYLHGAAADTLVNHGIGPIGLSASELAPAVRKLINQYNTL